MRKNEKILRKKNTEEGLLIMMKNFSRKQYTRNKNENVRLFSRKFSFAETLALTSFKGYSESGMPF